MIPFSFVAGVMTYVWPFVGSTGGYIAIAVVYGFVLPTEPPFATQPIQTFRSMAGLRQGCSSDCWRLPPSVWETSRTLVHESESV